MTPRDVQVIGRELAIRWSDGREQFIPLELLRDACPCAACRGEQDLFGNQYGGSERRAGPRPAGLLRVVPVGGYALQPVWADGHATGLYAFDYLRALGGEPAQ